MSLLFDRRGLGIALNDDQAPQQRTILARNFLPGWLAEMLAELTLRPSICGASSTPQRYSGMRT